MRKTIKPDDVLTPHFFRSLEERCHGLGSFWVLYNSSLLVPDFWWTDKWKQINEFRVTETIITGYIRFAVYIICCHQGNILRRTSVRRRKREAKLCLSRRLKWIEIVRIVRAIQYSFNAKRNISKMNSQSAPSGVNLANFTFNLIPVDRTKTAEYYENNMAYSVCNKFTMILLPLSERALYGQFWNATMGVHHQSLLPVHWTATRCYHLSNAYISALAKLAVT